MAYFIAGVNGVGKTTVINEIIKRNPRFRLFKGSLELMKRLGLKEGDYESLRVLPDDYKEEQVDAMMEEVLASNVDEHEILLIDAHLINYKQGQLRNAVGDWIRHVQGVFIVEARPELVVNRLAQDEEAGRKIRDIFMADLDERTKIKIAQEYLEVTRRRGIEIGERYHLPVVILDNSSDNLDKILREFEIAHRSIEKTEVLPPLK